MEENRMDTFRRFHEIYFLSHRQNAVRVKRATVLLATGNRARTQLFWALSSRISHNARDLRT